MTVIELSDEKAAALAAKAAAQGLTLQEWLEKLAEVGTAQLAPAGARRHISEVIRENMQDVPREVMESMPADGASQHDHYIYGWPKRDV